MNKVSNKQYAQPPVEVIYLEREWAIVRWEILCWRVWQHYLRRFSAGKKINELTQSGCNICLPVDLCNNQHNMIRNIKHNSSIIILILMLIIRVVAIFTQALISSSTDYILLHVLIQITSSTVDNKEHGGPCLALSHGHWMINYELFGHETAILCMFA